MYLRNFCLVCVVNLLGMVAAWGSVHDLNSEEWLRIRALAHFDEPPAQFLLGQALLESNPLDGERWLQRAAQNNYPPAHVVLARAYRTGLLTPPNEEAVLSHLKAAETSQDPEALYLLALYYYHGMELARDRGRAIQLLRRAAQEDYLPAVLALLVHYEPRGAEEFNIYLRQAARLGNADAQFKLANKLLEEDPRLNRREGLSWMRDAARQEHLEAAAALGLWLARGRDFEAAQEWFTTAAQRGHPMAQNHLGILFSHGLGVAQDHEQAVGWFRRSAAQNLAVAQMNLGISYLLGRGTAQNPQRARYWLNLAAEQQYQPARDILSALPVLR